MVVLVVFLGGGGGGGVISNLVLRWRWERFYYYFGGFEYKFKIGSCVESFVFVFTLSNLNYTGFLIKVLFSVTI